MSSSERLFHRLDRVDVGVIVAMFVCACALLLSTMEIGFTRDESFYFHAGREYIDWFRGLWSGRWSQSFTKGVIDEHWSYNHEHPVLMKSLFALSLELFHHKLGWMEASTAMRLPTVVFSAGLVSGVYAFGRQLHSRGAGVIAALALLLQPRFFFHAHMACFDAAIGAVWFATVYAYWRSYESKAWAVMTGVFWGIALATKLNAFFLPIVLVAHWLFSSWRGWGIVRGKDGAGVSVRWPAMPWAFVAMAALGPIIFYAHWPYIWFDTFERVRWYMNFHLEHVHYFVFFAGENLYKPPFPWIFPFAMTAVTVPLLTLVASALGGVEWFVRRGVSRVDATIQRVTDSRRTGALLVINLVFPVALIAQPSTPIFGGTKHWIPAMPYLCLFAGVGAVAAGRWASEWLRERGREVPWGETALASLAGALVVSTAAGELAQNHPYGTSYYNEVIGSHQGAADAKMMRQFWGYTSRQALDWLDQNAPKGSRVHTHNTTSWAWDEYKREGLVREDLVPASIGASDYTVYHHQKAFHYRRHEIWRAYGVKAPVHVLEVDGVPLVSIYERPRARQKRLEGNGKK